MSDNPNMHTCPKCGLTRPTATPFCPKCGAPTSKATSNISPEQPSTTKDKLNYSAINGFIEHLYRTQRLINHSLKSCGVVLIILLCVSTVAIFGYSQNWFTINMMPFFTALPLLVIAGGIAYALFNQWDD